MKDKVRSKIIHTRLKSRRTGVDLRDVVSEHNRRTNPRMYEDAAFLAAKQFIVARWVGNNTRLDDIPVENYPDAVRAAMHSIERGYRALIYIVPLLGAWIPINDRLWNHYAKVWVEDRKAKFLAE